MSEVYNLAADMGGMGFIENNKALCMLSVLINTHLLQAAHEAKVESLLLCQQRVRLQRRQAARCEDVVPLKEADAYPAMPEDGYGWEKLFSSGCAATSAKTMGSRREWRGSTMFTVRTEPGTAGAKRRRRPICRKIINAIETGQNEIEIWGDGKQTRSFMYIDDCVEGIRQDHAQRHRRAAEPGLG